MEHFKFKRHRCCRENKKCLKRYNRRIGRNNANTRLNLPSFISTIRTEFMFYSERSAEIRQKFRIIVYQSE
ncbi:hypothetical protein MXB_1358 [Myxobolus squamalis]|nr:hypothetical protein MXB_1358 [Myxobolus squamalis]